MVIGNVRIFDGIRFIDDTSVWFENGKIRETGTMAFDVDGKGMLLAPGFVDIHMHGLMGFDSMRPGDVAHIARAEPQFGVTAFCPASVSDTDMATQQYLESVAQAKSLRLGARVIGAYLEGPFLCAQTRGAHDMAKLRDPTIKNYRSLVGGYGGLVVRVTLAPEKPGGYMLVRELARQGVFVTIGHSAATAEEMLHAIDSGITGNTHTCNGMMPMHHRAPGVLGVSLADARVCAELIADMVHVHPLVVKVIYRAKGAEKCYFCTDSIEATGLPDGDYMLGVEQVTVQNGIARLTHGDSLAGSTLTMDKGLRNLVEKAGIPLADALRMSSRNPADAIGRRDLGRIEPDACADFILLDDVLRVCACYVRGNCEYTRT